MWLIPEKNRLGEIEGTSKSRLQRTSSYSSSIVTENHATLAQIYCLFLHKEHRHLTPPNFFFCSLFCNNGTRFDQRSLTCRDEALALPCAESGDYYASVKFFEKFDIFERARAVDEQRRTKVLSRLETLEDVEALEAQLQ